MMKSTASPDDIFYGTLAVAVTAAPMFLVVAAGTLPEGTGQRGIVVVYGLGAILAALTILLVMRASYILGVSATLDTIRNSGNAGFANVDVFDLAPNSGSALQ